MGIGSFAYLRRVFEKLISEEREAARADGEALEEFETLRLDEKIEALKHRLPLALLKHKAVYKVLSAGLHDLDEDVCLRHFPVMKAVILTILEDHLAAKNKNIAEAALEAALHDAGKAVATLQKRKVSNPESR